MPGASLPSTTPHLQIVEALVGCVETTRYDPCSAGNQVACNLAQAQAAATIQAQDSLRISEATRVAISAETTKVAAYAQATTAANEAIAQATRSVIDARSTAQAAEIAATKQAYDAQATATKRADDLQATSEARQIEATQQALVAESTRTALHYDATRAAVAIANEERQAEIDKNQQIQEAQTAATRELAQEIIGVVVVLSLAVTVVLGAWYGMHAVTQWLRNRAATVRTGEQDKSVLVFHLPGGEIRVVDPDRMIGPVMGPNMEYQPNDWKLLDRVTARDQLVDLYQRMTSAPVEPGASDRAIAPVNPPPMLETMRTFLPEAVDLPATLPPEQLMIGVGADGTIGGSRRDIRGLIAAGAPRSGKSTLLRSLTYQAAQAGWQLYLADPMSNTFVPELWNRVRALAYPVVESPDQLAEMLSAIEAECQRRAQLFRAIAAGQISPEDLEGYNAIARDRLQPMMFVADEFNTFVNAESVLEPLTDLARRGQKWGLLVVLAAHSWRSRDIPRATADLLQSRVVFRLNSREAARTILDNGAAAMVTHVTQPGRAVVVLNGDSQQVQTYRVDGQRIMALASGSEVTTPPCATMTPTVAERDEITILAELIRPVWESAGSKRAMARAAGFTQYGGSAANKVDAAVKWLEQRYTTATTTSTPPRSTVAAFSAE
jgi:DNA segregation ATPase FtsK/SpoIIIE-like protein